MFLNIFVNDQSTRFNIADPLMGAHDKVVHIENVFLVLTKEQLAALGTIHNQNNVILIAESCHWFQG